MRINFDIQNTQAYAGGFQVLPAGLYFVEIVEEKEAPLRSGNGTGLTFNYEVIEGEKNGARIRELLNLGHSSPGARGMAEARLKAICESVGLPSILDTSELHRKPFAVVLSVTKDNQGNDRNEVVEYRKIVREAPVLPSPVVASGMVAPIASAPAVPPGTPVTTQGQNAGAFWK